MYIQAADFCGIFKSLLCPLLAGERFYAAKVLL
jgi:hypothetical protein